MARKPMIGAGKKSDDASLPRKKPGATAKKKPRKKRGGPAGVAQPKIDPAPSLAVGSLNVMRVPIGKLKPAAYNARKDLTPSDPEYQQIARSLKTFGLVEGLVWNSRTGNLVGGHQRLKVLRDLGAKAIDVQVVDLPLPEEKALSLALNKVSGDWDESALALLLSDLTECDEIDTALTGFEAAEIDVLLADLSAGTAAEPEPVAVGGSYKVMATCRNQGEQAQVMKLLKRQKVACHTITRG